MVVYIESKLKTESKTTPVLTFMNIYAELSYCVLYLNQMNWFCRLKNGCILLFFFKGKRRVKNVTLQLHELICGVSLLSFFTNQKTNLSKLQTLNVEQLKKTNQLITKFLSFALDS